jgi:uncharacterized membrane protein
MKNKSVLVSTAVSSLLALGALSVSTGALAADDAKEKCYGIAKAGANDCAANGHSCQGQAKADNDPGEWKYVEKGQCAAAGGTTTAKTQAM